MPNTTAILTGREIEKYLSMKQVLSIVEAAFAAYGRGKVQMPPKTYLHLDRYHGDFRAMPAYIEGLEACGVKWVSVHPLNRRRGLPSIMALIILSDPRTGYPLAVMDGTHITNFRTGAAGGLAAQYLARKDSSRIGLVGCGVQAYYQLLALNEIFTVRHISVHDSDRVQQARFIKAAAAAGLTAVPSGSVAGCVRDRDIVVTTTPSRKPIVKSAWIGAGTHINAVGADAKGKEELEGALLKRAKIVVDDMAQASHSGEINVPLSKRVIRASDIYATLGDVMAGGRKGRTSDREVTIFDSTGLAIQDVAVASYVYKKAIRSRQPVRKVRLIP